MDFYHVDFMNLAFRNYHAFQRHNLRTSSGIPTGTLYGVTNFTVNLIKERRPDMIAVAMESDDSFRKVLYPDYKSNRLGKPSDFEDYLVHVVEMFHILGIPTVRIDGLEADDVIGCLINKAPECEHFIVSNDKDFMQLIDDNVSIYTVKNKNHHIVSYKEVQDKFGVRPDQVVDVLALMGDKVDCIPGVKGIGPKNASKLIKEHGSLQDIYYSENDMLSSDSSVHKKLRKGKDDAFMSQTLAKIVTNYEFDFDPLSAIVDPTKLRSKEFLDFCDRFELKSIKAKALTNLNGL